MELLLIIFTCFKHLDKSWFIFGNCWLFLESLVWSTILLPRWNIELLWETAVRGNKSVPSCAEPHDCWTESCIYMSLMIPPKLQINNPYLMEFSWRSYECWKNGCRRCQTTIALPHIDIHLNTAADQVHPVKTEAFMSERTHGCYWHYWHTEEHQRKSGITAQIHSGPTLRHTGPEWNIKMLLGQTAGRVKLVSECFVTAAVFCSVLFLLFIHFIGRSAKCQLG